MKIRIKGNSLRLRLVKSEVRQLAEEGAVYETIEFAPGQALVYSVESRETTEKLQAVYEEGQIRVLVPRLQALDWAHSETISLVGEQPAAGNGPLKLLVEKDFTCLNPRAVWKEEQHDNYSNPHPSCGPSGGSHHAE